jgi:hypothetical protein
MIRSLIVAFALLAIAAPAAAAHDNGHAGLPDAEIFATNNTALITDQHDPRLRDRLEGFARRVEDIIYDGGGRPRGSQLLDGVFFSSDLAGTTFERSRAFDVDRVDDDELHDIAETVRRRFLQQSVLTFDHLPSGDPDADAIELEVPHVTARALRDGLLADPVAQERLFGGSVTLDEHLLLVADRADADLARSFAKRIGGDLKRAVTRYGEREFVEAATAGRAQIEKRTLTITGTGEDDTIALSENRRLEIDFGDDGVVDYEVSRHRFDRIRVDGSEGGSDTLRIAGSDADDEFDLSARGHSVRLSRDHGERIDLDGVEIVGVAALSGADELTVDDLSQTDVFEVDGDVGAADGKVDRVVVNTNDDANEQAQNSITAFSGTVAVLGPTFVQLANAERTDRLRMNGRRGDDLMSASTDAMKITLDGGADTNTLLGGPGDDVLLGGDDFDLIQGRKGDDVVRMGGFFDSFTWNPGDGSDKVDGGPGRDGMFFFGSGDAETVEFARNGGRLRLTRDVGNIVMDVGSVETFDTIAGGGADLLRIGDVRPVGVEEVNASLAPIPITAAGDATADRIEIHGSDGNDAVKITGQVVIGGSATVTGLPVKLGISHSDGLLDTLAIDTLAGNDTVDTSGLQPNTIGLDVK